MAQPVDRLRSVALPDSAISKSTPQMLHRAEHVVLPWLRDFDMPPKKAAVDAAISAEFTTYYGFSSARELKEQFDREQDPKAQAALETKLRHLGQTTYEAIRLGFNNKTDQAVQDRAFFMALADLRQLEARLPDTLKGSGKYIIESLYGKDTDALRRMRGLANQRNQGSLTPEQMYTRVMAQYDHFAQESGGDDPSADVAFAALASEKKRLEPLVAKRAKKQAESQPANGRSALDPNYMDDLYIPAGTDENAYRAAIQENNDNRERQKKIRTLTPERLRNPIEFKRWYWSIISADRKKKSFVNGYRQTYEMIKNQVDALAAQAGLNREQVDKLNAEVAAHLSCIGHELIIWEAGGKIDKYIGYAPNHYDVMFWRKNKADTVVSYIKETGPDGKPRDTEKPATIPGVVRHILLARSRQELTQEIIKNSINGTTTVRDKDGNQKPFQIDLEGYLKASLGKKYKDSYLAEFSESLSAFAYAKTKEKRGNGQKRKSMETEMTMRLRNHAKNWVKSHGGNVNDTEAQKIATGAIGAINHAELFVQQRLVSGLKNKEAKEQLVEELTSKFLAKDGKNFLDRMRQCEDWCAEVKPGQIDRSILLEQVSQGVSYFIVEDVPEWIHWLNTQTVGNGGDKLVPFMIDDYTGSGTSRWVDKDREGNRVITERWDPRIANPADRSAHLMLLNHPLVSAFRPADKLFDYWDSETRRSFGSIIDLLAKYKWSVKPDGTHARPDTMDPLSRIDRPDLEAWNEILTSMGLVEEGATMDEIKDPEKLAKSIGTLVVATDNLGVIAPKSLTDPKTAVACEQERRDNAGSFMGDLLAAKIKLLVYRNAAPGEALKIIAQTFSLDPYSTPAEIKNALGGLLGPEADGVYGTIREIRQRILKAEIWTPSLIEAMDMATTGVKDPGVAGALRTAKDMFLALDVGVNFVGGIVGKGSSAKGRK